MSIVAVHGPNMWGGTGAGGGGTGPVITAPQVQATADQSNGWKFTFEATDKTRPVADYDWAFPGGSPATQADSKGPIVVTYSSAGSKTATLTIAAGAGPPAGGAYPISVTATGTTGGMPRSMPAGGEEPPPEDDIYDPADYTVAEVTEYAEANPDQIEDLIAAEEAGKNRSTLIAELERLLVETSE